MMKKAPILHLVCIAIFFLVAQPAKSQCLTAWKYYMPVTVTNNVSSSLSDYQVKVTVNTASLISASKMISTGDDIRFVDPSTCNTLYYWIESGINTSSTVIWVKVPSLGGSSSKTLRMYYGNSSAAAASDGDNTFLLFDDFNGSSLNSSKWNTYTASSGGSFSVSSGQLTVTANKSGSMNSAVIRSASTYSNNLIEEAMVTSFTGYYPSIALMNSGSFYGYILAYGNYSIPAGAMYLVNSYPNGGTFGFNSYINTTSIGTVGGMWSLSWPSSSVQTGSWPGGTLNGTNSTTTVSSTIHLAAGISYWGVGSVTFDWIRGRVYATKDASTSLSSEISNAVIVVSSISGSPFCTSSAISINVPFTITGSISFSAGNVFTAQLSDSSGDFTNPVNIGTLSSTNAGTISATIPSGSYGLHYRVRVINSTNSTYNSQPGASVLAIAPRPTAGIKVNATSQCLKNNSFNFNNNTTGSGTFIYSWNMGDGNTSAATSPVYTYSNPGTYNVSLAATNIVGCADTAKQTVNVNNAVAGFSVNSIAECFNGNSFDATNKSSGYGTLAYQWSYGDGNTSTSASPSTYSYTASGTYSLKLLVTSNGSCTDSAEQTITVNPKVFAGFKASNTLQCFNDQNFTFTNSSTVSPGTLSYKWSFGDGSALGTSTNPSYTYKNEGSYIVKLTAVSDKGCTDTISKAVQVVSTPGASAKAKGTTSFCDGGQVLLDANLGTGYTYQWFRTNVKITLSGTSSSYTAASSGSYKVVVFNANTCSDTSTPITVTAFPIPTQPTISKTGWALTSSKSAGYQWNMGGNPISGANSQSYKPVTDTGHFSVTITDSNGCTNTSATFAYDVTGISYAGKTANTVSIFPNPTQGLLNIDLSNTHGDFQTLQMVDMNGKSIALINISNRQDIIELETNSMNKGIYFIKLLGNESSVVQKVIVQ